MYFWSAAIISITTIVLIFKSEPVTEDGKVGKISFAQSYKVLWDIFKIPNVRVISVILLTSKVDEMHVCFYLIYIYIMLQ